MGNIEYRIAEDGTIIRGESPSPEPPKKSKAWLVVLLLLLVGGGIIGYGYYLNKQKIEPQVIQSVEVVPAEVIPVDMAPVEEVSDFPNDQLIKEFIENYYAIFGNKEYYKIDNFFAETVTHYFNETNVKGTTIKERYREYHEETLKTKSVSFTIRWNTFEQTKISNDLVAVSFIVDDYLDTERYGNQHYILKINMDINSDYKIVGLSESTIEKMNL
jgi:hypothetical protein